MPCCPYRSLNDRIASASPALLAAYAAERTDGRSIAVDPMAMMEPEPLSRKAGRKSAMQWSAPSRFVLSTALPVS